MEYKKDAWIAEVKQAVEDTKAQPSSGKVTAVAALRYIRKQLIDDLYGDQSGASQEDKDNIAAITDSFKELVNIVYKEGASDGFLSNASAAAKAAGYKGVQPADITGEIGA